MGRQLLITLRSHRAPLELDEIYGVCVSYTDDILHIFCGFPRFSAGHLCRAHTGLCAPGQKELS